MRVGAWDNVTLPFAPATVRGQPFCAVAAKLIQKKNSAIAAFTPRLVINFSPLLYWLFALLFVLI
ncbi:hypothetical protein PANT111_130301 [Pantoea brenneri]|uniref:Uncharacterized protein n=1 Tax=Pantoea brenneri TaxID=472694 RepID=A0AAX3J270_9GAMM|nr:hypothetical protein PANT111_130301 [Pantoea brenneri]